MKRKVFILLEIIGIVIIIILSFIVPNNPFELIPSPSIMSFDKPLWLDIIIICTFIYLLLLYYIDNLYDEIMSSRIYRKKIKNNQNK